MYTYTQGKQSVTVGDTARTRLHGVACYRVEGYGEIGLFLGDVGEALEVQERDDGSWTLWYRFTDDHFPVHVAALEAAGGWEV